MDLKQSIAGINHKYWGFMLIFVAKTQHFPLTLEDFSKNSRILLKTQGFLPKTQGFSSKTQDFGNSRNLRCRKKRQKKACSMTLQMPNLIVEWLKSYYSIWS